MTDNNKNAVIIFTRYPEIGKVKTRLAASIGNESAYLVNEILVGRTFKECLKLEENRFSLFAFYSDMKNEEFFPDSIAKRFLIYNQDGENIGEKMRNAFEKIFNLGFEKAVILGTDIPDISESILSKSFLELEQNNIVIGPSNDGGYYLLGMNKFYHNIFDDIKWGTESVFEKTIDKIHENNLSYTTIDRLTDIDVKEDLLSWYELNKPNSENDLVEFVSALEP